jgi:hypothetical protein
MCPLLPGRPSRGFAIKQGVIPNFVATDFTTYLITDVNKFEERLMSE